MHRSRWVNCSMASAIAFAALPGCTASADLDVVPGAARLLETDRVTGKSSVFDGSRVRIRAARGETIGLQVRLPEGHSSTTRLELPARVALVTAFSIRSIEVREPSTDMYGPSSGPGAYPDVLSAAPAGAPSARVAYFDVEVT